MTAKALISLLGLVAAVHAQVPAISIDGSRPYLDIVFERLEPTASVLPISGAQGLRLKLRNNCVLPVEVALAVSSTASKDPLLRHEIIEVTRAYPVEGRKTHALTKPLGYSGIDVVNTRVVKPGGELSFRVPLAHVTRAWFVRVEVELVHPVTARGLQPRTFVEFDWSSLPPEVRQASDRLLYGSVK